MWPEGETNLEPYPRVGDVVAELVRPKRRSRRQRLRCAGLRDDQGRKLNLAKSGAESNADARTARLMRPRRSTARSSPRRAQDIRSGRRTRVRGRWFLDSTGDGVVGALVGAKYQITKSAHLGASNLWNWVRWKRMNTSSNASAKTTIRCR